MSAARKLHMGVVHINEPSTSRVDLMPFSVKQSGLGREGSKYAMQEIPKSADHHEPFCGVETTDDRSHVYCGVLKNEGVSKVLCGHTNYALIDACHKLGIEYVHLAMNSLLLMRPMPTSSCLPQACRRHRPYLSRPDQRAHGRSHRGGRLHPDDRDCWQYAFVSSRPRTHQGIRFHADALQGDIFRPICKRVAGRRCEISGGHHAPRVQRFSDRPPRPILLDVPMDVFSQQVQGDTDTLRRWPNYPAGRLAPATAWARRA